MGSLGCIHAAGRLGLHMMWKARKSSSEEQTPANDGGIFALAPTGLATSIDAMAVGVGLAFVDTPIWIVAAAIGSCTFMMVSLGIMLGHVVGRLVADGLTGPVASF